MTDLEFIQQTLQLAAQGKGLVSPNPLVGSLVVKDGRVVGQGFHRYAELKHAEVWALEEAGAKANGATIYVNLEPCSHTGNGKRTAPCVEAIIKAGIRRVVASMVDPNPKVNGRGFELLRAAGIQVATGLLEREAQRLNEKYAKMVKTGLPFVHLKTASSLDGRIATRSGDSKWITGEQARTASQALRHEYDAILVGINTALNDDPLLTDRTGLPRNRPLIRVVLDAGLRLSPKSQLVQTARNFPLLVFAAPHDILDSMGFPIYTEWGNTQEERKKVLQDLGVKIVQIPVDGAQLKLPHVLSELGRLVVTSVLVEGGAEIAGSFVEARLVDKLTFFLAPKIIGGREAKSAIAGDGIENINDALNLRDLKLVPRGSDLEITGYPA